MKELNNIEIGFIADKLDLDLISNEIFLRGDTVNQSSCDPIAHIEAKEEIKIIKSILAKLEG
tara:strand:- start:898 stop:1083 length:186 start_codon:yes stop_codon:yes gene_type:complete